ncbi:MAG: hypothetical protein WD894_10780 [Pirellulales bacterium]
MSFSDRNIRVTRLQDQGHEDLLSSTTAEERVAMMWQLAVDAWTFMGVDIEPEFRRDIVRVIRRSTECSGAGSEATSLEERQLPEENSL